MGSNERREREKRELRTRILDAARELFAEHGFDAVTMRKIAEKIEYTPTALYFHFSDKDTLIRELCVDDFLALAEHFAKLADIGDPVQRFREIGRAYADFAITHPHHYRLMFMMPSPFPGGNPKEAEAWKGDPMRDAYAFLRWTLQQCIDKGHFREAFHDAELCSQISWSCIHGIVALHITHGKDEWVPWRDIERRVDAAVDALVHGMISPSRLPPPSTAT